MTGSCRRDVVTSFVKQRGCQARLHSHTGSLFADRSRSSVRRAAARRAGEATRHRPVRRTSWPSPPSTGANDAPARTFAYPKCGRVFHQTYFSRSSSSRSLPRTTSSSVSGSSPASGTGVSASRAAVWQPPVFTGQCDSALAVVGAAQHCASRRLALGRKTARFVALLPFPGRFR